MGNVVWYLFFGSVLLLIVSLSLKLGYHLSKNRKWIQWDIGVSLVATALAIAGLLIMTGTNTGV